ncbi:MAG: 23S rRNA (uracil-5-)-methyltransferase RumA [Vicingaceae bacterium]|nr:MAG: 23S rRNA (uracil-5-)-methyltransferase RumA [Vicingaceae bacterium]
MSKKETIHQLTIEKWASEGKAMTRIDGKVYFIPYVIPGETVKAKTVKNKNSYAEALPLEIISPHPKRLSPDCQYFGLCGGCKWQHIPYEMQLEVKHQQVKEQFTQIGHFAFPEILPPMKSPEIWHYRNKMDFSFSNMRWMTHDEIISGKPIDHSFALGFHLPGNFKKVIDIDQCLLCPDGMNEIKNYVRSQCKKYNIPAYNLLTHQGVLRSLIIRSNSLGEMMVILSATEINQPLSVILNSLPKVFPFVQSVYFVQNNKKNDAIHDLEPKLIYGRPYLTEQLNHLKFRIHPLSFFQTNTKQTIQLYDLIEKLSDLKGHEIVYDLYSGVGTIGLYLARRCKKIIGVEYVEKAVVDAEYNASVNHIHNAEFFAGDMAKILSSQFVDANGMPDVVITDPPRNGMDRHVCEKLLEICPEKIVYVSCNPATQARDLNWLTEKYEIVLVQPVDMFPHTYHVENVVLLKLKK